MQYMAYVLVLFFSYLLGTSSMAFYLSRLMKVDVRHKGSGNLGASNATILLGWPAGILVGAHDIGKAALAVYLAKLLFPELEYIGAVAGVACVLGHMFPFYLRFKGGKGFASYLGMTLALNWKLALVVLALVVIVTVMTDYIVVGTVTTIITVPVYMGIAAHSLILAGILCVGTIMILWKHRENFVRIAKGQEIGLSSTFKGKHRER